MFSLLLLFSVSKETVGMTGYVADDFTVTTIDGIYENGSCFATFSDKLDENGNMHFSVTGTKGVPPEKMLFCAGYVEGKLMQKRIYQAFENNIYAIYGNNREYIHYDDYLLNYFEDNYKYMKEMIDSNKDVKYWQNVAGFVRLSDGMFEGYKSVAPETEEMNHSDFLVTNNMVDIMDLMTAHEELSPTSGLRARCTAAIRLLPDLSDVYVMHNTWTDYRNGLGLTINYNFPIEGFAANKVSITTIPGMISSCDDFYIADSGLIVFETSIMSQDIEMLRNFTTPRSLLNGYRTLMAMFTARNGTEWAETFLKHNSGTYNNDYFVTDVNLFKRKQQPEEGFVTLIEQVPSEKHYVYDVTRNLTDDGFISSFNVPFMEEVYYLCKYDKVENTSQYFHPYMEHPRYLISKRELPRITNIEDFKKFSRYNNYKKDQFSKNDPLYTISSREDLLGEMPIGALNQKVVAASRGYTTMEYQFCGAPTNDNEDTPTFQWSKSAFANFSYVGLPDIYNFTWITVNEENEDRCASFSKEECMKQSFCGYCGKSEKCMAGNDEGPFNGKCYNEWETQFTSNLPYIIALVTIAVLVIVGGGLFAYYIYKRSRISNIDMDVLLKEKSF